MTKLSRPAANTAADAPRHTLSAEALHDLRTPLNQIIGYAEMLEEQAREEGQTGFVPDLKKIRTAGQQLLALLDNGSSTLPAAVLQSNSPSTWAAPDRPQVLGQMSGTRTELPELSPARALILVVDDNEANRDVLSHRLERQGHGVAMAQSGHQALALMRAQAFDMVLLDIMMPEMDGYEVLKQIKADHALRHIPVIMISALDEVDSVVRCIEMGAEDYLPKPFNPTLLKARVYACLEKKRAHDRELRFLEQLQQNYKRLQELEKLRDDLMHMIIHDLRTPLSSVMMGMQTLEMVGDLNQAQLEVMGIALTGGETLLGMINHLLDVDKMEAGSMQLDYAVLDAAHLVNVAASQIASLAQSRHLTLEKLISPGLPPFRGDENKLLRTLVNLLGNAIKFTAPGGTISVATSESDDQQSLVFSVTDTGEGIPPEAFEHIFEKFGQVKSRQEGRVTSTGLGLTFCKLAVQAHNGQIEVQSVPGQGSTFAFTIPLMGPLQSVTNP